MINADRGHRCILRERALEGETGHDQDLWKHLGEHVEVDYDAFMVVYFMKSISSIVLDIHFINSYLLVLLMRIGQFGMYTNLMN